MTVPSFGTWDYTWDGATNVLPTSGGDFLSTPDPPEGSIAGGIWTCTATTYDSLMRNVSAAALSAWCEARAVSCPSNGSIVGGDYCFGMVVTNYVSLIGYTLIAPDAIYAVDNSYNANLVVSMDLSSDFHEYVTVLNGAVTDIYVDGTLVGSTPAVSAFGSLPQQIMGTSAPATIEYKGVAFADGMNAPDGGEPEEPEEPLPGAVSEIHLGAAGLTIDFDDVAHYSTQLTSGQIGYHNTVGRGL